MATRVASPAAETRHGIGVSPGTAYGPVVQVAPPVRPPADEPAVDDQDAALADVKAAFEAVALSLEERATRVDDTAPADPQGDRPHRPRQGPRQGRGQAARRGARARPTPSPGPSRSMPRSSRRSAATSPSGWPTCATSARGPSQRSSACLRRACRDFTEPSVVVAEDLAPAETATLNRALVVGIITEAGGRTSHTAILAAQMGIPAVVQLAGATEHRGGHPRRARRRHRRGDHRARPRARRGAAGPRGPAAGGRSATSPGRDDERRPRRRPARQHRRRRGRRRGRRARPRGRRPLPHRVRLPLRHQGADGRGADADLPRRLRALRGAPRRRAHPRRGRRQAAEVRRPRAGGEPCPRPPWAAALGRAARPARRPARGARHRGRARPAPTCASWRRWSPRPRRRRGSPVASARTACPRPAS